VVLFHAATIADQDPERLFTYASSPLPGIFDTIGGAVAKWVAGLVATGGNTTMHTSGSDVVYVSFFDGDRTVPTSSARWALGSPQWDHEYKVNGVIHSALPNEDKTVSYVLYWLEYLAPS
jgi:hypothetical protein